MSYSYKKDLLEHLQLCVSNPSWVTFPYAEDLLSLKLVDTDRIIGGPYGVDYFCKITKLGEFYLAEFHGQEVLFQSVKF